MVSTPHGAFKERLAEGLAVHIRHGLRRSNRAFCSRLELRWSQMEPEAALTDQAKFIVDCGPRGTKLALGSPFTLSSRKHKV